MTSPEDPMFAELVGQLGFDMPAVERDVEGAEVIVTDVTEATIQLVADFCDHMAAIRAVDKSVSVDPAKGTAEAGRLVVVNVWEAIQQFTLKAEEHFVLNPNDRVRFKGVSYAMCPDGMWEVAPDGAVVGDYAGIASYPYYGIDSDVEDAEDMTVLLNNGLYLVIRDPLIVYDGEEEPMESESGLVFVPLHDFSLTVQKLETISVKK